MKRCANFMKKIKGDRAMRDIAIFTPEVAEELIERGFEVVARSSKAWYFTDCYWIRIAINEALERLEAMEEI